VRDESDLAGRERSEAVVHAEKEAVQVGKVSGYVEGHDLPAAVVEDLVAAGEALDDRARLGRLLAVADDVLPGRVVPHPGHGAGQGILLLGRQAAVVLEIADEQGVHVLATGCGSAR
jgi:hypothetical protein